MSRHVRSPWQSPRFWVMWPGLFMYFRASRRARVIITTGDSILLVRARWALWFKDGHWALPGGGVHEDEEVAQGAARELAEELGIITRPTAFQLLSSEQVREYGFSYQGDFMLLRLESAPALTLQADEIAEARWFKIAELQGRELKREVRRALELLKDLA